MAAPPPPVDITFDTFNEWYANCGVKQIKKKFDQIIEDAKKNGVPIEAEMKAQGYKDYAELSKNCEQFPLVGWPEDLGELGSGFVLYFQFICFMAFLLVFVLLLQAPAMSAYSGEDWLQGWHWHEWKDGWKDNAEHCKCLPTALFPFQRTGNLPDPNYGLGCKAWDADWVVKNTTMDRGKWACASWCFADAKCQAPEKSGTAKHLWNRHVKSNNIRVATQEMVRAVAPCKQDTVATAKCSSMVDKPFPGISKGGNTLSLQGTNAFIGAGMMTPGNFGPDQADNSLIPLMFFIIICGISVITMFTYQLQIYTDRKVDAGTTAPNDFAILVKGLPVTATDEKVLKQWFEQNSVCGRAVEVVKVVIGWDVQEYQAKRTEINDLRKQIVAMDVETQKDDILALRKQVAQTCSDLASAGPDRASRLRSSGLVVVVFRYQADLRAVLDRWESFWSRYFYSDPGGCYGLCKGEALPLYPIGDPPQPVLKISIERAANPGDIHWEELGKDPAEKRKLFMETNGKMGVLVLIAFGITYGLNYAQRSIKQTQEENKEAGDSNAGYRFLSFVPGLGLAMINMVLMVSARKLGDKEYHDTWTTQEFSQAAKMLVAIIINTAGVLLFSNLQPKEWYEGGGLIDDAFMILLLDALLPPIIFYFDMKHQIMRCKKGRITQARLDNWNERRRQNTDPKDPAQVAERQEVQKEFEMCKRLGEPSEMDNPRRYANALNTFFCCLFFSPVFPLAPLMGCAGLFLQYWIDKYLLLRWYKRPKRPYNARLAMWSLRLVKYFAPLCLSGSFFFFLSPSWDDKGQVFSPFLMSLIVSAIMIFVPSTVLRTLMGLRILLSADSFESGDDSAEDYYQAQYMWSKAQKYHKDHFLYKNLSEKINPEFLTAGADSGPQLDALKGAFAAAKADDAETGGSGVALKGGKIIGGDSGTMGPTTYGASAGDDAPATKVFGVGTSAAAATVAYGVSAPSTSYGGGAPPPADVPTPEDPTPPMVAPTPVVPTMVAPTPHRPAVPQGRVARDASQGVVWEYEGNHGFQPFADDCQQFMESKYQEFASGGKGKGKGKHKNNGRINVRTSGTTISVDLDKMTSKVQDSHKIRNIRRQEG